MAMHVPYKSRILQHVARRGAGGPQNIRELAADLGVPSDDREAFGEAVAQLAAAGQVVMGSRDTVGLPPMGREVVGRFRLTDRGFGFVIPEQANAHGDLFVPPGQNNGALTGDRVRASVRSESGRGGREGGRSLVGRIVEIVQRGQTSFVGTVARRGKLWMVDVDGKILTDPVIVPDAQSKGAKVGSKVVIELTKYPEGNKTAEGVITKVLGEAGKPSVETEAICHAYGLAMEFPGKVGAEARAVVERYNRDPEPFFEGRQDVRDAFTVTIDPPDAKDYDDAISIARTKDGVELGVHIADVATFVAPGSALDEEAQERGNSVYLPRLVVPMLPEVLSNGICSLQPGVPRLARSVYITYDRRAKRIAKRYANTVIESDFRLTYLEAQALIDGDRTEAAKHARAENEYTDQLVEALQQMTDLSKAIRKRRQAAGMIELALPEVELVHDDEGHVVDAQPEDDAYTHKLIEAFMVEANEAVAELFADLNVDAIRRTHPDPSPDSAVQLQSFARVAGYNIPDKPTRKELQHLLDAVRDKPAARAVHLAVLKTLTRAEYSCDLIGHFALASEHYLHFTSPIRRYPDLTAHRQLAVALDVMGKATDVPGDPGKRRKLGRRIAEDERCPDLEVLSAVARHCSVTERNAEDAERELRDLLVLQLMEKHIGEQFPGTVTGVMGFGLFVQIDKYLVEGMVRTDALPGAPAERWKLNQYTGALTAERSGRTITLGDQFTVKIMRVDLGRREMDLQIIEQHAKSNKPRGGKVKRDRSPQPKQRHGKKPRPSGQKGRRRK
jgi:ribonuclease R